MINFGRRHKINRLIDEMDISPEGKAAGKRWIERMHRRDAALKALTWRQTLHYVFVTFVFAGGLSLSQWLAYQFL